MNKASPYYPHSRGATGRIDAYTRGISYFLHIFLQPSSRWVIDAFETSILDMSHDYKSDVLRAKQYREDRLRIPTNN